MARSGSSVTLHVYVSLGALLIDFALTVFVLNAGTSVHILYLRSMSDMFLGKS